MGDENGVIMVKRAVAERYARNMRRGVIAEQLQYRFVPDQSPIGRHCERFEGRRRPYARKDVRYFAAFITVALSADVMEFSVFSNINFHHAVETRCSVALFQQGQFCT